MDESLSESDLNNIVNESSPTQYISNRSQHKKRRRSDDFATYLTDFRMEMKQMIMSLFAQHKEDTKDILPTLKEIQNVNTNIQASMEFLATQNSELFKKAKEISANPFWFCIVTGFSASYCFMLPVGTPGNLIVQSAAKVSTASMIKAGAMPTLTTVLITWLAMVYWAPVVWPVIHDPAPSWAQTLP